LTFAFGSRISRKIVAVQRPGHFVFLLLGQLHTPAAGRSVALDILLDVLGLRSRPDPVQLTFNLGVLPFLGDPPASRLLNQGSFLPEGRIAAGFAFDLEKSRDFRGWG
jgi:hypothetical protein